MFFEFFFFWLVVIILCEVSMSPQMVGSIVVNLFILIFAAGASLIESGADLFGALIIATYSSVFIIISLAYVHFNKYANHTQVTAAKSPTMAVVAAGVMFIFLFFTHTGSVGVLGTTAPKWIDYTESLPSRGAMTVTALHEFLYRSYSVDVFLLNVYLFFGLVISTRFMSMSRPSQHMPMRELLAGGPRSLGAAATPIAARIKIATKLRRQIRRKNTSRVR